MHRDIKEIIYTPEQIQEKIREIAAQISNDYKDKDLILIGVLKGCIIFMADLSREITIQHKIDFIGTSSYGSSKKSSGQIIITKDITIDIRDKDILFIEDIFDTGQTLKAIIDLIKIHNPRSIEVCCLLYKKKINTPTLPIKYYGLEIPDDFVVGYGLDYNECYRNLKFIGILKEEIYK